MRHTLNSIMDHHNSRAQWVVRAGLFCKQCNAEAAKPHLHACAGCDGSGHLRVSGLICDLCDGNGKSRCEVAPKIVRMACLCWLPPAKGHGELPLHVAVTDWGGDGQGPARTFVRSASGYGYDKTAACLAGCTVGGVELGDHCDYRVRPTLDALCQQRGWERVGGDC